MSDDEPDNLPAPRRHYEDMNRLEEQLRRLDGPLSVSNKVVPLEASDIGDVDERPNPRAKDLEYPEGAGEVQHTHDGTAEMHFFFDGPNIHLAGDTFVGAGEDIFINNLKEWA